MVTAFTRIIFVLSLLRSESSPPRARRRTWC
jgi:hypothetical protein